jgi:hypothetical protein
MQAIRAATIAAAAIALTLACASLAQAAVVTDPDEPGVTQDRDIEWASESHITWPSGSSSITHTIKTFAPYASRPCLNIRTATESYLACSSAKLLNRTLNTSVRISVTETPAGAPDTITYAFTSHALCDPAAYRWNTSTRDGTAIADRTSTTQTVFGSLIPPKITIEEPIPFPDLPGPIDPPDWP